MVDRTGFASCCLGVLVRTSSRSSSRCSRSSWSPGSGEPNEKARWRETWSAGDWVGFAVLITGVAVAISAAIGRRSFTWYLATGFLKERMLEYGLWAIGGADDRDRSRSPDRRARGARPPSRRAARRADDDLRHADGLRARGVRLLHGNQGRLPVEDLGDHRRRAKRDLPHAAALRRVGAGPRAAAALLPATVAATAFAVYVVATTPYHLDLYPYYEAHGLAIAALANRIPRWPDDTITTAWSSWRSARASRSSRSASCAHGVSRSAPPPRSPSSHSRGA